MRRSLFSEDFAKRCNQRFDHVQPEGGRYRPLSGVSDLKAWVLIGLTFGGRLTYCGSRPSFAGYRSAPRSGCLPRVVSLLQMRPTMCRLRMLLLKVLILNQQFDLEVEAHFVRMFETRPP